MEKVCNADLASTHQLAEDVCHLNSRRGPCCGRVVRWQKTKGEAHLFIEHLMICMRPHESYLNLYSSPDKLDINRGLTNVCIN